MRDIQDGIIELSTWLERINGAWWHCRIRQVYQACKNHNSDGAEEQGGHINGICSNCHGYGGWWSNAERLSLIVRCTNQKQIVGTGCHCHLPEDEIYRPQGVLFA